MTSRDLNDKQLEAIEAKIGPMLRYLNRLNERGFQRWPVDDPLRLKIAAAHDAVYGLRIALHYLHVDNTRRDRFGLPFPPPEDAE
jgi:hypothetical protein